MKATGITSLLPKGNSLFFWEYDGAELWEVLEEAQFLNGAFDLEVWVMQSSKMNYHLVSFDILPLETVFSLQNWTLGEGDFLDVKASALFDGYVKRQWNALRISEKGKKPKPFFVKVFPSDKYPKSLRHFRLYQSYVNVPNPEVKRLGLYVPYGDVVITVYNTGWGSKRRPFSLQDFLLARKEKRALKKA